MALTLDASRDMCTGLVLARWTCDICGSQTHMLQTQPESNTIAVRLPREWMNVYHVKRSWLDMLLLRPAPVGYATLCPTCKEKWEGVKP